MAFTQADLESVESAIASGASSVTFNGRSVTTKSVDELLRIRSMIRAELGLTGRNSTRYASHSRGFYPRDLETGG